MNNEEIIAGVALAAFGEDYVNEYLQNGQEIPLHTVQGWKARIGDCYVRKGEHGLETRLWKKRKKKGGGEEEEEAQGGELELKKDFYLAKSYLFRQDQMVKA